MHHFPDLTRFPTTFPSVEHIDQALDKALIANNQGNPRMRMEKTLVKRMTESGVRYLCKVSQCKAYLLYHYSPQGLKLSKAETEHEHPYAAKRQGRAPKQRNIEIEECFDELQLLNFKPKEIVLYIHLKFGVSKQSLANIKLLRNRRESMRTLLETLSKYDNFKFECKDLGELAAYFKGIPYDPT